MGDSRCLDYQIYETRNSKKHWSSFSFSLGDVYSTGSDRAHRMQIESTLVFFHYFITARLVTSIRINMICSLSDATEASMLLVPEARATRAPLMKRWRCAVTFRRVSREKEILRLVSRCSTR